MTTRVKTRAARPAATKTKVKAKGAEQARAKAKKPVDAEADAFDPRAGAVDALPVEAGPGGAAQVEARASAAEVKSSPKRGSKAKAAAARIESARAAPAMQPAMIQNPISWDESPDPTVMRVGKDFYVANTQPGWQVPRPGKETFPLRKAVNGDFNNLVDLGHLFPAGHQPDWILDRQWAPDFYADEEWAKINPEWAYVAAFTAGRKPDAAKGEEQGKLVIGLAHASRPEGPYHDVGAPFLENRDIGLIDAHIFRDEKTGKRFFYWKEDWNDRPDLNRPSVLNGQEIVMTKDGPKLVGERLQLLQSDRPHEKGVVEGFFIVPKDGKYLMLFSYGHYTDKGYGMGVAVGDSPLGPFKKLDVNLLPNDDKFEGRGHGFHFQDASGQDWLMVHGYPKGNYEKRVLLLYPMYFGDDGVPWVDLKTPGVRPAPEAQAA